jgi:hypothetical protein
MVKQLRQEFHLSTGLAPTLAQTAVLHSVQRTGALCSAWASQLNHDQTMPCSVLSQGLVMKQLCPLTCSTFLLCR